MYEHIRITQLQLRRLALYMNLRLMRWHVSLWDIDAHHYSMIISDIRAIHTPYCFPDDRTRKIIIRSKDEGSGHV